MPPRALPLCLLLAFLPGKALSCELELRSAAGLPVPLHPKLGTGFLRLDLRGGLPAGLGARLRTRLRERWIPRSTWTLAPERDREETRLKRAGFEADEIQAILAHAAEVEERLRAELPERERPYLIADGTELRWQPDGGAPTNPVSRDAEAYDHPLGGHRDGGAFAATTSLVGAGTLYQPGNSGVMFSAGGQFVLVPTGETLVLSGLDRPELYGLTADAAPPGLVATVHDSPTTPEPRLVVLMRFLHAKTPSCP